MALIPSISACLVDCRKITISDTTGFYNVSNNPGGWNDDLTVWKTNVDTPYLQSATVSISLNGGEPTVITVTNVIQTSVYPEYTLYEYTPVNSNNESNLQDGYYNITYTVVDSNDNTYETEIEFVVYCNVACCVSKLAAAVANESSTCDSEAYDDFLTADGIYQALKAVAESKGTQEFYKLLTKLQRLCSSTPTGGCGCGCS
jgi:hypothetical protein